MLQSAPQHLHAPRRPLISVHDVLCRALADEDLRPLGQELLNKVQSEPEDAELLMDLSLVLQIIGDAATARQLQSEAMSLQRCYAVLPAWTGDGDALRVLAVMMPGVLMDNTPIDCLLAYANVQLDVLYVNGDGVLPDEVPDHDVLFVAIGESSRSQPLLRWFAHYAQVWPRPVLNHPEAVRRLSRDIVPNVVAGIPGLLMPPTACVDRLALEAVVAGEHRIDQLLQGGRFPLIVRPVDSHAGYGLEKIDDCAALAVYLLCMQGDAFHVSLFIDYSSTDGQFRKYRVALVQGVPYVCHVGISSHWMVHYANAGMADSAVKRAEEARLMDEFDQGFARRHASALQGAYMALGLDYVGLDCAETSAGELLIFEADSAMVVHDADPADLYPYKKPQMRKVFRAFEAMLGAAASR
ncbi:glutathione synthase/RimK-type ligase-like ATP-grasp enzyme [Cupriavidus metallidurans]|jgi:glutathione synthase/RimK-type ligase-like ATP-grasp enzyme|uniref:ATP-grasp domain-containing protein n=1 Tax=Burkholderiaceae TaxID=119060 RepID=UPI0004636FD0|nr:MULTISPECIES: hypothetical protein [Burkholderiaceae]AVA33760.1 RimK family alpha-L-glutamate ligase [Cupriavidus metallidurans]KWW32464.1 hypothetical protein AU374_06064 [Cupriavidus metallidurans]MCA3183962.1 RimK family alpha-L-glutamate ligase [Cupriavidus sp.]MCA3193996.1 RimK family alpha-L-glutamate ligase [Cupriavidus sp.]MCA3198425.1 RimK family alpha-L-glutamate ligase [Cupriavidus sp.]